MYENNFSYDANGNITAQMRKDANGTAINDLTYNRRNVGGKPVQNRLYHVNDAVSSTAFTDDIDDQDPFINNELVNSVNNYGYDEIGNLNRNNQKEIAEMVYNVTGKVKEVRRTVGSNKENLKFDYDANGNRIAKHVYTSDDVWMKSDYYVNDAQGNNMAIYTLTGSSGAGLSYQLAERHIYGSSSIGILKTPVEMIGTTPEQGYTHTIGDRRFNGSNHLGNVLSIFTDKKIPLDTDNNGIIDGYLPEVIAANDYAPFGGRLTERTFNKELYPNSFNGKRESAELDGEQDYGERDYDPKKREFDKDDPLITGGQKYPELSPYQFASNRPIDGIDLEGLEYATFTIIAHDGIVMDISVTTDYELKNKGTKGPGIQYNYINLDENGKAKAEPTVNFVKNGFFDYGIYGGSNNPKLPEEGGKVNETKDYYGLAPIDEYDDKYKKHDENYDLVKAVGKNDAFNNPKTIPADKILVKDLKEIKANKKAGGKDAITGNDYSKKGSAFATRAKMFFNIVINRKEKIEAKSNPRSKSESKSESK